MNKYSSHLFQPLSEDIGAIGQMASDFAANNPHYMAALGMTAAPVYDYLKGKFKKHGASVLDRTIVGQAYNTMDKAVDNTINTAKDAIGIDYNNNREFDKFRGPIRSMVKDEVSSQLKNYNLKPNSSGNNMPSQPAQSNGKTAVGTPPTPPPPAKPTTNGNNASAPRPNAFPFKR